MDSNLLFQWNGRPPFSVTLSLALQHLVAMIVGCVTPAILVANAATLSPEDSVLLIQSALFISAISTLIQLFPIGGKLKYQFGAGLPIIMGISFAYVPTMQSIAGTSGVSAIAGAMLVGGIVAFVVGIFAIKIRKFFPSVIIGTVVFTIGLSLYPTAINYMAGGNGNTAELITLKGLNESLIYGSWQNWLVAILTLAIVVFLNNYTKGFSKLASILLGMVFGYIVSIFFGMVDLTALKTASWVSFPKVMHFGINFDFASCIAIAILFAINSIQAIGDFTATTIGGMDREPTDKEIQGGIVAFGISNIFGAFIGGLPTATFSQNVGIVSTNKAVNRNIFVLTALMLLIAGLCPKIAGILTSIPQCVLGGATITVFSTIAMTGMKLITSTKLTIRNTTIVGLSAALGVGLTQSASALAAFPESVTMIFGKSPVVVATLMALLLNQILPKEEE